MVVLLPLKLETEPLIYVGEEKANFLIEVDMKAIQARTGMTPVVTVLEMMTYTWSGLVLSAVGATTQSLNRLSLSTKYSYIIFTHYGVQFLSA